jgi:hypothetical protein
VTNKEAEEMETVLSMLDAERAEVARLNRLVKEKMEADVCACRERDEAYLRIQIIKEEREANFILRTDARRAAFLADEQHARDMVSALGAIRIEVARLKGLLVDWKNSSL